MHSYPKLIRYRLRKYISLKSKNVDSSYDLTIAMGISNLAKRSTMCSRSVSETLILLKKLIQKTS